MPTPQQFLGDDPSRARDRLAIVLSNLLTTPRDIGALGSAAGTALLAGRETRPPTVGQSLTARFLHDLGQARQRAGQTPLVGPLAALGEQIGGPARARLQPSSLEEFLLGMAVPGGPRRPPKRTDELLEEIGRALAPRNPRLPVYRPEEGDVDLVRGAGQGPSQAARRLADRMARFDQRVAALFDEMGAERRVEEAARGRNPRALTTAEEAGGRLPRGEVSASTLAEYIPVEALRRRIANRDLRPAHIRYIRENFSDVDTASLLSLLSDADGEYLLSILNE